jgi:hypothetical protein
MTAQVATTTHNNPPADPDTARAHAITMATLVTEAAVVIGTTTSGRGITVREFTRRPPGGTSRCRSTPRRRSTRSAAVFAPPRHRLGGDAAHPGVGWGVPRRAPRHRPRLLRAPGMTAARITAAVAVADQYAQIDGAHHKMWVIDQMLRRLLQDDYDAWVAAHPDWDAGIAP